MRHVYKIRLQNNNNCYFSHKTNLWTSIVIEVKTRRRYKRNMFANYPTNDLARDCPVYSMATTGVLHCRTTKYQSSSYISKTPIYGLTLPYILSPKFILKDTDSKRFPIQKTYYAAKIQFFLYWYNIIMLFFRFLRICWFLIMGNQIFPECRF